MEQGSIIKSNILNIKGKDIIKNLKTKIENFF